MAELTEERLQEAEAWAREIKRRDTIATLTGSLATTVLTLIEELRKARATPDWWVYSTALCPPVIEVIDRKTGKLGWIEDYSKEEWEDAFHAPSEEYRWLDGSRVKTKE